MDRPEAELQVIMIRGEHSAPHGMTMPFLREGNPGVSPRLDPIIRNDRLHLPRLINDEKKMVRAHVLSRRSSG